MTNYTYILGTNGSFHIHCSHPPPPSSPQSQLVVLFTWVSLQIQDREDVTGSSSPVDKELWRVIAVYI